MFKILKYLIVFFFIQQQAQAAQASNMRHGEGMRNSRGTGLAGAQPGARMTGPGLAGASPFLFVPGTAAGAQRFQNYHQMNRPAFSNMNSFQQFQRFQQYGYQQNPYRKY